MLVEVMEPDLGDAAGLDPRQVNGAVVERGATGPIGLDTAYSGHEPVAREHVNQFEAIASTRGVAAGRSEPDDAGWAAIVAREGVMTRHVEHDVLSEERREGGRVIREKGGVEGLDDGGLIHAA